MRIVDLTDMRAVLANVRKAIAEKRLQAIMVRDGIIDSGGCMYRVSGHPGCGCAIGVNIPDDAYTDIIENVAIPALTKGLNLQDQPIAFKIEVLDSQAFDINRLQILHDYWATTTSNQQGAEEDFMNFLAELEQKYSIDTETSV